MRPAGAGAERMPLLFRILSWRRIAPFCGSAQAQSLPAAGAALASPGARRRRRREKAEGRDPGGLSMRRSLQPSALLRGLARFSRADADLPQGARLPGASDDPHGRPGRGRRRGFGPDAGTRCGSPATLGGGFRGQAGCGSAPRWPLKGGTGAWRIGPKSGPCRRRGVARGRGRSLGRPDRAGFSWRRRRARPGRGSRTGVGWDGTPKGDAPPRARSRAPTLP